MNDFQDETNAEEEWVDPMTTAHKAAASYRPPFDPILIAASPQTIRLANMWPSDTSMQQMLVAVIRLVETEMKVKSQSAILTVPTAVTLAGCGFQLGRRLIESAIKSATGIIDITKEMNVPDTIRARLDVRQGSLQQFEQSGWNAVSPFPPSVVDHWWQVVKQNQIQDQCNSSSNSNSQTAAASCIINSETEKEKVVCAATVTQWIKLILQFHSDEQLACKSPLLALGMIEDLQRDFDYEADSFFETANEESKWKPKLIRAFLKLNCKMAPDLDSLLEATSSEFAVSDPIWQNDPAMTSMDPDVLHIATAIEYAAMMRILDGNSWYHHANVLRTVAEQFIRGERQSHASDVLLSKMKIRPMKIEGILIPHYMSRYNFSMASLQRRDVMVRLHLQVADAAGNTHDLILKFNNHEGNLVIPRPTQTRDALLVEFYRQPDGRLSFDARRADPSSDTFEPNISPEQEMMLHHMQIATQLSEKFWKHAGERAHSQLGVSYSAEQNNSDNSSASSSSNPTVTASYLGSVNQALEGEFNPFTGPRPQFGVDVRQATTLFRQYEFEQIALQTFPLLDFQRWGMSRFCDLHTTAMRRGFQACLIDAAMKANEMTLLPTVLVELISDYYTLESMPYLSLEEQQALIAAPSQ